MTISADAGTSRSTVSHLTMGIGAFCSAPATSASLTYGGNITQLTKGITGWPPIATATGIGLFIASYFWYI
ncbi:hypothetical protein D3C83_190860 [compost metagenome]